MAANNLSILKPSVNNLTARVFVRAAGLDFEETDVWGGTGTPEFLAKDPAQLTPLLECDGLPQGSLWESIAIMSYLCNKHGLEQFYPSDPAKRAMIDSANCYLLATFYPLLARATYPSLGFPQYAGEVGTSDADDEMKAKAAKRRRSRAPLVPWEVYNYLLPRGPAVHRRRFGLDRGHPLLRLARVPEGDRLRLSGLDVRVHDASRGNTLGEAYSEPRRADAVRGYVEYVKSQVDRREPIMQRLRPRLPRPAASAPISAVTREKKPKTNAAQSVAMQPGLAATPATTSRPGR